MIYSVRHSNFGFSGALLIGTVLLAGNGCQAIVHPRAAPPMGPPAGPPGAPQNNVARELSKMVLPAYVIEPPDVLMIDAIRIAPKQPYHLAPLDTLVIQVQGTPVEAPISGVYAILPEGTVKLGPQYGAVSVAGMTVDEAEKAVKKHLEASLKAPQVSLSLGDTGAKQQIAGPHLVGPDGTVTLGSYGNVSVIGLTVPRAKEAVQQYLTQYFEKPEISLEVFGYNSKVYYIVTQGAGMGDGVYRFPITGNETVLDAIAQINGLQQASSKKIWIARPTDDPCRIQNLPVSWEEITADAYASTNYQILPGDRVFIAEDKWIALDTGLAKIIAPMERVMGFSLLSVGTVTRFSGAVLHGGGNAQGTF
jgi:polysaccharide export outer membrane protein